VLAGGRWGYHLLAKRVLVLKLAEGNGGGGGVKCSLMPWKNASPRS
jgi:hypothetical protein